MKKYSTSRISKSSLYCYMYNGANHPNHYKFTRTDNTNLDLDKRKAAMLVIATNSYPSFDLLTSVNWI